MYLKQSCSEELVKVDNFSEKAQFKFVNSFFPKKKPKSLYLVVMCNLTHLQDGHTGVKFMLKIIEKIYEGSGS
jgi:hypothetical protein